MRVKDIINILDAELVTGEENLDLDIQCGCGADLMSDVMACDVMADAKEHVMLLTGLVNAQVVRTAEMMDIKVVVFVRGKDVTECIIGLAADKGITVLKTRQPMFIACGKLYSAGIAGRGVWN